MKLCAHHGQCRSCKSRGVGLGGYGRLPEELVPPASPCLLSPPPPLLHTLGLPPLTDWFRLDHSTSLVLCRVQLDHVQVMCAMSSLPAPTYSGPSLSLVLAAHKSWSLPCLASSQGVTGSWLAGRGLPMMCLTAHSLLYTL